MKRDKFTDEEIPYHILEKFGLTREMLGDLPVHILEQISDGHKSPMLPVSVTDSDGNVIRSKTRFSLIRMEDGTVDVLFYPQLEQSDLTRFSDTNRKLLQEGKPVLDTMTTADGKQTLGFHQIDFGTRQILSVPTPVIGRNLQYVADIFHLSNAELTCLRNGEPLTVSDNDDLITIGIDLTTPTGIRVSPGDERQWRERKTQVCEKYNFGCFGCWIMDDDGSLDYVREEDYSEELWAEMKKNGARKALATQRM